MAGVKGRSGGARLGAGRKAKPPVLSEVSAGDDPLKFLIEVQKDVTLPLQQRVRAAIAAAQYVHPKMGEGGKKAAGQAGVEKATKGRYAAAPAPKLVVNNR